MAPRQHLPEFDDSDDGGEDDTEEESPWKNQAVDITVQYINQLLVAEIEVARVQLLGRRSRSGIENASNIPSTPDQEEHSDDEEERDDNNDEHGLCFKDVLRSKRAEHTEASLAGDHHRHEPRCPSKTKESYQVVIQDEMEDRTSPGGTRDLQVNPVGVQEKVRCHVEDVRQRLEEQTQVDSLLQAVFGEHYHVQDVGWGTGKIRHIYRIMYKRC